MSKILISTDWEHTLRNPHGLDLNIVALMLYAQSKQIPVALTTFRDIESTVMYMLYPWQHQKPTTHDDALAASIHYWQTHFFQSLNFQFNSINARCQPAHQTNYYQTVLLPLEKKLTEEIINNRILSDSAMVRNKIQEYTQHKEDRIENNDVKQAQIQWLLQQYPDHVIYHIDDNETICNELPNKLSTLTPTAAIQILHYKTPPLFSNDCSALFQTIGLDRELNELTNNQMTFTNEFHCLSLILIFLLNTPLEPTALAQIKTQLDGLSLSPQTTIIHKLINALLHMHSGSNKLTYLIPNKHTAWPF